MSILRFFLKDLFRHPICSICLCDYVFICILTVYDWTDYRGKVQGVLVREETKHTLYVSGVVVGASIFRRVDALLVHLMYVSAFFFFFLSLTDKEVLGEGDDTELEIQVCNDLFLFSMFLIFALKLWKLKPVITCTD